MELSRTKRETWLFGLAFLLALAIRLIRLGASPLTDIEAAPALQALHIAQGVRPTVGANSLYLLLTSVLFFAFGSYNFLARFVPALMGSALVLVPFLFQHRIKPRPALILAFFLAFDPGLLALSRQADSSILAMTGLLFAWGFWERKSPRLAGVFAALALLSGPSIWVGLLGLALTRIILVVVEYKSPNETRPASDRSPNLDQWKVALVSAFITFLLVGTLFFLVPAGLSNAVSSLPVYLHGWVAPSGVPAGRLILSLVLYQPLTIILALVALVRGWWGGSRRVIRISIWMLVALLLAIFYPARQVHDLGWMLIPLSALAALELSHYLDIHPQERIEVAGVAALTVLILAFAWLDLASLVWTSANFPGANPRIWLLFGALFLLAVSLLLVAVGWSARIARLGAIWGLTIMFGLFMLGAGMATGGIRVGLSSEFWADGSYPTHAKLLASTVDDLSQWSTGNIDSVPVTILGMDSPALVWDLRDHKVNAVDAIDPTSAPPLIITSLQGNPATGASYRGQDFTWNQQPAWDSAVLSDWLKWLTVREMPQSYDTIMLWARNDLFIDVSHQPTR